MFSLTNRRNSRYLQDFNESAYNSIELNSSNLDSKVAELSSNPLAVYRTYWRFLNFIRKWAEEPENLSPMRHRKFTEIKIRTKQLNFANKLIRSLILVVLLQEFMSIWFEFTTRVKDRSGWIW